MKKIILIIASILLIGIPSYGHRYLDPEYWMVEECCINRDQEYCSAEINCWRDLRRCDQTICRWCHSCEPVTNLPSPCDRIDCTK